jgi:hypothetical protein
LQTAVADYLARSDLQTYIPNFIQNAENKLYRALNLRNEETALSITVASNVAALPADFKSLKFAYMSGTPADVLQWVPIEELYRKYPDRSDTTSNPKVISREGSNFIFGPASVDDEVLNGIYYAKQDPLRTTDPSWYATNAPEVLLYASLMESAPFIQNDERLSVWSQLLEDAVFSLKVEQENAEYSGGQLLVRPS